jgi:uncharacterized repeat protein (TIGR02543 family)
MIRLPAVASVTIAGILLSLLGASPAKAQEVATTVGSFLFVANDANVAAGATLWTDDSTATNRVVTIPNTVEIDGTTYAVTGIGNNALANKDIVAITLPESLVTLGTYALYGNPLVSVTLPDSLVTIGIGSFYGTNLTSIVIPPHVTYIGVAAFQESQKMVVKFAGAPPATMGETALNAGSLAASVTFAPAFGDTYVTGGFTRPTWQGYASQSSFTVTFNMNGYGTQILPLTVVDSPTATLPTPTTSVAGMTFFGWFQDEALTIPANIVSPAVGDYTLYAKWNSSFLRAPTPTIVGAAKVGDPLTADAGTWSPTPTLTYSWKRSGSNTVLGTDAIYTPVAADVGETLRVTVTATLATYFPTAKTSSATSAVISGTLDGASTPTISGTAQVGKVLSVISDAWPSGATLAYAWKRSGSNATIGTGARYRLTGADYNCTITVTVTASSPGFNDASKTSAATASVAGGTFLNAPSPLVAGVAHVGLLLSAVTDAWSPTPAFTYAWKRSGSTAVIGTSATYRTVSADLDHSITVTVTGTLAGYTTVTKTSAATESVVVGTVTPVPTISGVAQVGKTLTAVAGTWDPDPTFVYAWVRSGSTATIATGATYSPVLADVGHTLKVKVTGSWSGYASISKTSALTASVISGTFLSSSVPTISGTKRVGETLTAVAGKWSPSATLSYAWKRVGSATVLGTDARYTLVAGDLGATVTVTVTATSSGFTTLSKTSTATSAIGAASLSAFSSARTLWLSAGVLGQQWLPRS